MLEPVETLSSAEKVDMRRYLGVAMVPVASGTGFPSGAQITSTSAVLQMGNRTLHYCPQGIEGGVRLAYTAVRTTPDETDGTIAVPLNIGIEANAPAPWEADVTYAIGAKVTRGRASWVAAVENINVIPGPATSATWTSVALDKPMPVTFNGTRAGKMATSTTPAGTPVTVVEDVMTDIIPCSVEPGGWLALDHYVAQPTGDNRINLARNLKILDGEYQFNGTSVGDRSISGDVPSAGGLQGMGPAFVPYAILGVPKVSRRYAVALIGDSLSDGITGRGVAAVSLTSGGTGFTANDVGKIGTVGTTGASAGAVNSPALVQIGGVSGGAVNILWLLDGGSITDTANQPSQTLPNLTNQAVTFTDAAGSGLVVSWTAGASVDTAGKKGAQGAWQRALIANGLPSVNFVRGSDSLTRWQTRKYSRLAALRKSNVNAAIPALGLNDIPGNSAANVIALMKAFNADLRTAGIELIAQPTLTPYTVVSTDGFLTEGNQTVHANNTVINTVNDAIRAKAVGNDECIDLSDTVSSARGSGKFKTDGSTVGLWTIDGVHDSKTGVALKAAALTPLIASIFA